MGYDSARHDIGILRQDGVTEVGMMLVRDKNGAPVYSVVDDEFLSRQQTQVAGYEGLPPEKEIQMGQDDWRGGFGLETYDSNQPKRYFASYNMDLRFRGMAICSPKATAVTKPAGKVCRCFANFNDKLYAGLGTDLCKLDSDGDEFANVNTFGNNITDLEPFADDKLYVALGGSNDYSYMTTAEAFTSVTSAKADFFQTVHATVPTLYKAIKARELKSTTDPTANANWSGATNVGSSLYDINELVEQGNALYVPKEDAPYYIDSDTLSAKILAEKTKFMAISTGGKNSLPWDRKVYFVYGRSIIEYDNGVFTWLDPGKYSSALDDFAGDIQAAAGDEQWLYIAVNNGTKIEILAGRWEVVDNILDWRWHPIVELTLAGCEKLFVSSVYKKRLWIASTDSSDSLYYIPLYDDYGDPVDDTNRSFQTDGYFYTPWHHGEFKGDTKAFIKLTLHLGHTYDADVYLEGYYQLWGDTTWSSIGDFKGTATVRKETKYINVSSKPASTKIRFKFVAKTDDTTITPVLNEYDCRGMLYPTRRDIILCTVYCADDMKDAEGADLEDNADTIAATLREAKNDATWPVTFYDIDGETKYVRFLSTAPLGMKFEQIVKAERGRVKERHFNLLLQEVALS